MSEVRRIVADAFRHQEHDLVSASEIVKQPQAARNLSKLELHAESARALDLICRNVPRPQLTALEALWLVRSSMQQVRRLERTDGLSVRLGPLFERKEEACQELVAPIMERLGWSSLPHKLVLELIREWAGFYEETMTQTIAERFQKNPRTVRDYRSGRREAGRKMRGIHQELDELYGEALAAVAAISWRSEVEERPGGA